MEYEDSGKDLEEDIDLSSPDVNLEESLTVYENEYVEDSDGVDNALLKDIDSKAKTKQLSQHALEVRRAIEDYLENKRLRRELDYLYDELGDDEASK